MANKPLETLNIEDLVAVVKTTAFLKKIAETAVNNLKTRISLGYSVSTDYGPQNKFKPLAESTVKKRKRLKDRSLLSDRTTPKKSNLTETGKLVDSITYRVAGGKIEIFIEGEREKLVEYLSPERPFFHLSETEVSRLVDIIDSALNTYLKQRK